jgi:hypothetical protein
VSELRRVLIALGAATVAALGVCGLASGAAFAATVTPIATGLDNPRGLSFGPDGRLYVAEAGHGGGVCLPPEHSEEEPFCVGFTGGISAIGGPGPHGSSGASRVLTGIVSFAEQSGFGAVGLDGVSARGNGGLFGIITESTPGLERLGFPLSGQELALAKSQVGHLIQANPSGHWKAAADVGDVDFRWTEEHFKELGVEQPPDSNPYSVLVSGDERWVIDAAANVVDEVRPNGSVRVVAFIPSPPVSDSVPTCIDRGADGAFYVGELTGFGNGPGKSIVWRLVPGQAPEQWASGLTGVTGCGFGPDGQFYATEFSVEGWESFKPFTGAVVRVAPHSTSPIVVAGGLSFPNGFAADAHGALYVSNWSVAPANSGGGPTGEVVRISP